MKTEILKNVPWEEDEIEFIDGDWAIERGKYVGLYSYVYGGISGITEVDAVQLIEWHMAKVRDYPTLHPWENSDIAYTVENIIVRDPRAGRNEWYLIEENNKILDVNKFWLILNGKASYGKNTAEEIAKVKVPASDVVWEGDDIVLTRRKNVEITRAYATGCYKIFSDGVTSVHTADYLVSNGYAKKKLIYRLDKLAKSATVTLDAIGEELHSFWYSCDPASVNTLRQLAKLAFFAEKGEVECVVETKKLYDEKIASADGQFDELQSKIENVKQMSTDLEKPVEERNSVFEKLKEYAEYGVLDWKSVESAAYEFNSTVEQFNKYLKIFSDLVEQQQKEIDDPDNEYDLEVNSAEYDFSIFPSEVVREIEDKKATLFKRIAQVNVAKSELKKARDSWKTTSDGQEKEATSQKEELEEIKNNVREVLRRKESLDECAVILEKDSRKKKPKKFLFNHTYKGHNIRLITAYPVKRTFSKKYCVKIDDNEEYLSPEELVYLGLAEYIKRRKKGEEQ